MTSFNLNKKSIYALLLTFLMSAMLPACSSSEEEESSSSGGSGEGDTDMTCDEGDSQQECLNDIL